VRRRGGEWWAVVRFWRLHRKHRGYKWVAVDPVYGMWCNAHGVGLAYTAEPDAVIAKIARHM
jgi:hypothetical protein